MADPRISVIVTCCNLGAYLPEALASIRAQTLTDFEVVVVDDGSTDPLTHRILGELPPDIAVVHTENRGLSAARNCGVRRTRGEFICAVDADDVLLPTLLQCSVERLDADPSLAFVSHWLEAFGDESWQWTPGSCDFPALLDANTVNGAALVRRSAVEAVGGWDEDMRSGCEDWDFWISLVERGFRGAIIPEILFRYRRRADSMSRIHFAEDGLSRLYAQIVEKHADTFRPHLRLLVARRAADIVGNRAQADAIDERLELELRPALARARDDLAAAERRRHSWDEEVRASDMRRRLGEAEAALARLGEAVADGEVLREQVRTLNAEISQAIAAHRLAVAEIEALRASRSWRITAPLRTSASLLSRIAGRRA